MTLPRQWEKHAVALVEQASPIEGEFFRSVEIAHGHPDDVVSGEGTRLYGGRFVRAGIRAVFGSADEATAFKESAARINRLAGRSGTRIVGYPRITYVIAVGAGRHAALTTANTDAAAILPACLDPNDLSASQEVGEFFRDRGIQAIAFPSAIPDFSGRNPAVFRDVVPAPSIVLANRQEILEELRHLADRMRK